MRIFPPTRFISCIMSVKEKARIVFSHSPPLTDYYIIYEVGMCAVLHVLIPSTEMQLLPARYVYYGIFQLSGRGAWRTQRYNRERRREEHISANPHFSS